jgi:RNA polymerase sigma factor (sigma-70 family)
MPMECTDAELIIAAREGEQAAKDELLRRFEKLIWSIVRKYADRNPAVDLDDLFQIGAVALMDAIRLFDVARGSKLSTYVYIGAQRNIWAAIRIARRDECRLIDPADVDKFAGANEHERNIERDDARQRVAAALDVIEHPKWRQAVECYYGIGGEKMTLAAIARESGCTRERIRQRVLHGIAAIRKWHKYSNINKAK